MPVCKDDLNLLVFASETRQCRVECRDFVHPHPCYGHLLPPAGEGKPVCTQRLHPKRLARQQKNRGYLLGAYHQWLA